MTDHKNGTVMLLYCQLFQAFFNSSYSLQERGTLDTTGTISFVAVIFIARPNKFHKIRRPNHKYGIPSEARRPRLVANKVILIKGTIAACQLGDQGSFTRLHR